jgi:hypothetical protein
LFSPNLRVLKEPRYFGSTIRTMIRCLSSCLLIVRTFAGMLVILPLSTSDFYEISGTVTKYVFVSFFLQVRSLAGPASNCVAYENRCFFLPSSASIRFPVSTFSIIEIDKFINSVLFILIFRVKYYNCGDAQLWWKLPVAIKFSSPTCPMGG